MQAARREPASSKKRACKQKEGVCKQQGERDEASPDGVHKAASEVFECRKGFHFSDYSRNVAGLCYAYNAP